MDSEDAAIGAILFVVVVVSFLGGGSYGKFSVRYDAIEAGVGEWVADTKTGETTFKWKEAR